MWAKPQSLTATAVVLGGLEIEVEFDVEPADPSVGIMHSGAAGWSITHIAGRKVGKKESTAWLEKRIKQAGEEQLVDDACGDALYQAEHYEDDRW